MDSICDLDPVESSVTAVFVFCAPLMMAFIAAERSLGDLARRW